MSFCRRWGESLSLARGHSLLSTTHFDCSSRYRVMCWERPNDKRGRRQTTTSTGVLKSSRDDAHESNLFRQDSGLLPLTLSLSYVSLPLLVSPLCNSSLSSLSKSRLDCLLHTKMSQRAAVMWVQQYVFRCSIQDSLYISSYTTHTKMQTTNMLHLFD